MVRLAYLIWTVSSRLLGPSKPWVWWVVGGEAKVQCETCGALYRTMEGWLPHVHTIRFCVVPKDCPRCPSFSHVIPPRIIIMGRPMSNYVAEWQDLGNNNAPGLSLPNKLHTSKQQGGQQLLPVPQCFPHDQTRRSNKAGSRIDCNG